VPWVADAKDIEGKLSDEVRARGDAARIANEPVRANLDAAKDARLVAEARRATRGTESDSDRAAAFKADAERTRAANNDQPAETPDERGARQSADMRAWSEQRSATSSHLGEAHDVMTAKSQQLSDDRERAAIRDKLADLRQQESRVMRFPEGSAVRVTHMARIEEERRAIEGRLAVIDGRIGGFFCGSSDGSGDLDGATQKDRLCNERNELQEQQAKRQNADYPRFPLWAGLSGMGLGILCSYLLSIIGVMRLDDGRRLLGSLLTSGGFLLFGATLLGVWEWAN
jgi:hypothetical protein